MSRERCTTVLFLSSNFSCICSLLTLSSTHLSLSSDPCMPHEIKPASFNSPCLRWKLMKSNARASRSSLLYNTMPHRNQNAPFMKSMVRCHAQVWKKGSSKPKKKILQFMSYHSHSMMLWVQLTSALCIWNTIQKWNWEVKRNQAQAIQVGLF